MFETMEERLEDVEAMLMLLQCKSDGVDVLW